MSLEILCLHSSGLSGAQWGRFVAAFSDRYTIHTPDLLGYGANQDPYSMPFHYEQDLKRLQGLLDRPMVVVGHSYGGLLSLRLALHNPENVQALALFDPIAWGALRSVDPSAFDMMDDVRFGRTDVPAEEWLESFVDFWGEPGSWKAMSPRARDSMLGSFPKLRDEVHSLIDDRTPADIYSGLKQPTLLLTGERSPIQQQRVNAILAEAIPGADSKMMPGGHMAPITHSQEYLDHIEAFLQGLNQGV